MIITIPTISSQVFDNRMSLTLSKGTISIASFSYKRPDGINSYKRPDGTSTYIRP
jgi:hypothetical protein